VETRVMGTRKGFVMELPRTEQKGTSPDLLDLEPVNQSG